MLTVVQTAIIGFDFDAPDGVNVHRPFLLTGTCVQLAATSKIGGILLSTREQRASA